MTSTQVVETSVTNNSASQNYSHPDDHTIRTCKSLYCAFFLVACIRKIRDLVSTDNALLRSDKIISVKLSPSQHFLLMGVVSAISNEWRSIIKEITAGQRTMVNGQWSTDNGQWTMSGQDDYLSGQNFGLAVILTGQVQK